MTRKMVMLLVAVLGFGLGVSWTSAQTTTQGSIAGTVHDATGAIIPNAAIRIVNNATNVTAVLNAGASGDFTAPLLDPGDYTVTVTAPGFGTFRVDHVIVQVGQTTQVDDKNDGRGSHIRGRSYRGGSGDELRVGELFLEHQFD